VREKETETLCSRAGVEGRDRTIGGELSSDQELVRVVDGIHDACMGAVYAEMTRIIDGLAIWPPSPFPMQCDMCVCIATRRVTRNAQSARLMSLQSRSGNKAP
jgi:hypothetical protein